MSWIRLLEPDLNLEGPILNLTPDLLIQNGLRGLVLDVDDTLVPTTDLQVSAELINWVEKTRAVAKLWLVSNNLSQSRIGNIARSLKLPYLYGAGKPSRRKLRQAIAEMDLPLEQVAMVGDRLFTDVLAGNRLGVFTILVEPMVNPDSTSRLLALRDVEIWISQRLGASLKTMRDRGFYALN